MQNQIADQTTENGDGEDPPSMMVDGQVPSKDKKSPKEKTELEISLDGYELGYQGNYKCICSFKNAMKYCFIVDLKYLKKNYIHIF